MAARPAYKSCSQWSRRVQHSSLGNTMLSRCRQEPLLHYLILFFKWQVWPLVGYNHKWYEINLVSQDWPVYTHTFNTKKKYICVYISITSKSLKSNAIRYIFYFRTINYLIQFFICFTLANDYKYHNHTENFVKSRLTCKITLVDFPFLPSPFSLPLFPFV